MRFLLSSTTEIVVTIAILVVGFLIAVFTYIGLKKRNYGKNNKKNKSKLEVELKKEYVSAEEMKLVEYIHKALPKDFIAFPRVGVDQIVSPSKNMVAFNSILSKYVDIVIFLRKTMEPVMIVDIVWDNEAKQQFHEMDHNVVDVLSAVKLKTVKIKIEPAYDVNELRTMLLNALPDKLIAMLKKDYIDGK